MIQGLKRMEERLLRRLAACGGAIEVRYLGDNQGRAGLTRRRLAETTDDNVLRLTERGWDLKRQQDGGRHG
jgi:hypothetical protein